MEALSVMDFQSMGFVMLVTFGAVSAVNFWKPQTSKANFLLSVGFAIAFGFVPADLGSIIANKIKEALAIAVGLNGLYQGIGGIAKKVGQ